MYNGKLRGSCLPLALLISIATIHTTTAIAGIGNGKPFVALQDQIVEVQGSVSTLEDQIEELVGRVETVEERVLANENAIDELFYQNEVLQALIASNLTSIEDINNEIDALQLSTEDNSALIATLQSAISAIEADQIIMEADLQAQIDNNLDLIEALQSQLDSQAEWETFQANLTAGQCPDGSAVIQIMDDGTIVCGAGESGGGSSGTLATFTVFSPSVHLSPGRYGIGYATCPEGTVVTGTAWVAGGIYSQNFRFTQTYAQGSIDVWQPANSARVGAWYATGAAGSGAFRAAATCLRIIP